MIKTVWVLTVVFFSLANPSDTVEQYIVYETEKECYKALDDAFYIAFNDPQISTVIGISNATCEEVEYSMEK